MNRIFPGEVLMAAEILVVDDEEQIRKLIAAILEKKGHTVRMAEEGRAALRELAESKPDLVILDILMPGMEGLETLREMTVKYPDLKVLAMSGAGKVGAPDYLKMAEKFGSCGKLEKPFTTNDLREAVDRALDAD